MLYAIIGQDVENSTEKRLAVRPAHLQRIEALNESGRLVLAGPFPADDGSFMGSLIVADFDSLDEARLWAEADPYMHHGVFSQVEVKPFRKVLP